MADMRRLLAECMIANERFRYVYLNNPKVGCSSIKMALWMATTGQSQEQIPNPHDLGSSPFSATLPAAFKAADYHVFTFVRNPFVRLVSAYLNKIVGKEAIVWDCFVEQSGAEFGFTSKSDLTFDEFVSIISRCRPEALDPHWRPQYLNTLFPLVLPDFVGHLELMDAQLPAVLERIFGRGTRIETRFDPHRTAAQQDYLEYYRNPETLSAALSLYFLDFSYFQYSLDPAVSAPLRNIDLHGYGNGSAIVELSQFINAKGPPDSALLDRMVSHKDEPVAKVWLCLERLRRLDRSNVTAVAEFFRDNRQTIIVGSEELRSLAVSIAAGHGLWRFVRKFQPKSTARHNPAKRGAALGSAGT